MKFGSLLLVAAPLACLMSAPASATVYTYDLGTLTSGLTGFGLNTVKASSSPFQEIYEFYLPYSSQIVVSGVSGTSVAKAADSNPFMTGGNLELFSGTPPNGNLVDSTGLGLSGSTGNNGSYSSAGLTDTLAMGEYYLDISGVFDPGVYKTVKGKVTFTADSSAFFGENGSVGVTAAVPEVSTWAMMLLGFVGLGFAGYSRSGNVQFKRAEA